jgi:galactokinase
MSGRPPPPPAARVRAAFRGRFGGDGPRVFFAPGRVNLVGAHLDYNGGDVLPLAVDRGIYVAARLRTDGRIRLASLEQPSAVDVEAEAMGASGDPAHTWANYPLGVWREFAAATGRRVGVELQFSGDLPMASGMSSSAAIEIATATALDALHGTRLEPAALAMMGHRAENDFVGLKCGIMDQFASALGRRGHALWLHCHTREYEHVPLDDAAFEILVLDTRKPRTLASTGFNQRVRECAAAHAALRAAGLDRPYLAAYTLADLERAGAHLTGIPRRRARHVVTEMRRVGEAVAALRRRDTAALGAALDGSHASARADYEVSCEELDEITDAARGCDGVFGARLTGAGFGGCAIALVRPGVAGEVAGEVAGRYRRRFGVEPRFEVLHAGSGPREVD